jgi:hypothetical protein
VATVKKEGHAMAFLHDEPDRRSPVCALADWWHDWTRRRSDASDLACCAEGDIARMAGDLGVSATELKAVARQGPEAADLLLRRMAALDLDSREVADVERPTFLDLQRVCTMCEAKRRCARDLSRNPNDAAWEDYCPNVATLKMLSALPWASRREW